MFGRVLALALLASLVPSARADELPEPPAHTGNPQVTLSLAEYERIRRLEDRASLTVVDTLRLGGSFKSRNLTISFSGRSSGKLPPEEVLAADEGVFVYGCTGDAIVSKSETGFTLTPLARTFHVKCRLASSGTDRLELKLPRSVLWVESQVPDGELVSGQAVEGARAVSVVRRTAAGREALPASATGRYRITLKPDETRFRYEIEARNPNRGRQALEVTLRSGEHVLQVDAAVPYELEPGRYRFELPPGDTRIVLTGTLGTPTFTPPVDGALQYVLLDSHPLLLTTLSGSPKRVSPEEVGIPAEFRGAQALLLGKGEKLDWSVTRLEALRTTSFAVRKESHVLFVGASGPVLGESAFAIDNQGASDVSMPLRPQPTFASLASEPILLTTNKQGDLRLPLGRGNQDLVLQHRQTVWSSMGIAAGAPQLPSLSAPSSHAVIEVRYPAEWLPLFEGFASEDRVHLPRRGLVLLAALVFLLTDQAFRRLGLPSRLRMPSAALLTLAALVSREAGWAILAADAAVIALVLVVPMRRIAWTAARISLVVLLAAVSTIAFLLLTTLGARLPKRELDANVTATRDEPQEEAAAKSRQSVAMPPPSADAAAGYQGLPARFQMPSGAHRSRFTREMLAADGPRHVRFIAISRTLAFWLAAAVVAGAAASVLRSRREIAAGWKALLAEARRAPAPALDATVVPA
ncbi:MAG: hypothetical protein NEA02_00890 [Thermoanaerobaculia bacterium]|nr:hypothetical protein [Thermoanaerobaculia bacterium]